MGFNSVRQLVDSAESGKEFVAYSHKSWLSSSAGQYRDTTMINGNPISNIYASEPFVAARVPAKYGIPHGGAVSPSTKVLRKALLNAPFTANVQSRWYLCDFLLYYPFFDESISDAQVCDNTVTLPRYASGEGLQIFAVSQGGGLGSSGFELEYVDELGVTRTTGTRQRPTANSGAGVLCTPSNTPNSTYQYAPMPFIPLAPSGLTYNQSAKPGIRSLTSVRFTINDLGYMAFVIVKPLISTTLLANTAPGEVDLVKDLPTLPAIHDDAVLGWIGGGVSGMAMANTILQSELTFTWN